MQKPERIDLSVAKNIQLVKQFAEFVAKIIFKPTIQIAQVQMLASLLTDHLTRKKLHQPFREGWTFCRRGISTAKRPFCKQKSNIMHLLLYFLCGLGELTQQVL